MKFPKNISPPKSQVNTDEEFEKLSTLLSKNSFESLAPTEKVAVLRQTIALIFAHGFATQASAFIKLFDAVVYFWPGAAMVGQTVTEAVKTKIGSMPYLLPIPSPVGLDNSFMPYVLDGDSGDTCSFICPNFALSLTGDIVEICTLSKMRGITVTDVEEIRIDICTDAYLLKQASTPCSRFIHDMIQGIKTLHQKEFERMWAVTALLNRAHHCLNRVFPDIG